MKRRSVWLVYLIVVGISVAAAHFVVSPLIGDARPEVKARVEGGVTFAFSALLLLLLARGDSRESPEYRDAALFATVFSLFFFMVAVVRSAIGA